MAPITMRVHHSRARPVLNPARLIVAGYTGRNPAAVKAHIDELAAEGIPPPPSVPTFYPLDPRLLTTEATMAVTGQRTSGEVEPVYVRAGGRWYLGVGSDHTDRDLERADIARAKATCGKPIGGWFVALPDLARSGDEAAWDATMMSSWVDGAAYQDGTLAALRSPRDLLPRLFAWLGGDDGSDIVVYGGTVPLHSGFHFGSHWRLRLQTPAGVVLEHEYAVVVDGGHE